MKVLLINANSVDPDHMIHFAASDLGRLCLPITLLGVSQQKWLVLHLRSNLYHSMGKFSRRQIDFFFFLFFPKNGI